MLFLTNINHFDMLDALSDSLIYIATIKFIFNTILFYPT